MLDGQSLLNALLEAARQGASATLQQIATDARRRAPVRRIFKGGSRRKFRSPVGITNQRVTGMPYSLAYRTARVASTKTTNHPTLTDFTRRGRANSAVPVTRHLEAIGARVAGDADINFREVRKIKNNSFEFAHTKVRYKVGKQFRILDLRDEFLARVARDVSHGRGITKVSGQQQYGGKLRESIKVVEPIRQGTQIIGYVTASAIEHGFNYAYAQEFGTAHNRPQPYLRPAARAMHRRIKDNLRNSMATYLAKITPGHIRLTNAEFKITVQLGGGFKSGGAGSVVTIVNNQIDRTFAIR